MKSPHTRDTDQRHITTSTDHGFCWRLPPVCNYSFHHLTNLSPIKKQFSTQETHFTLHVTLQPLTTASTECNN